MTITQIGKQKHILIEDVNSFLIIESHQNKMKLLIIFWGENFWRNNKASENILIKWIWSFEQLVDIKYKFTLLAFEKHSIRIFFKSIFFQDNPNQMFNNSDELLYGNQRIKKMTHRIICSCLWLSFLQLKNGMGHRVAHNLTRGLVHHLYFWYKFPSYYMQSDIFIFYKYVKNI